MYRKILSIATPLILSNVTIPLLGLINIGLMGHISSYHLLAALGIGVMVFNLILLTLNFLRMGTTGLIAQAYGRSDSTQLFAIFLRSAGLSAALGIGLILLLPIILWVTGLATNTPLDIQAYVAQYVTIRIFSAPATLFNFVVIGFFIGVQKARLALLVACVDNLIAIISGLILVRGFHFAIAGIAWADVLSQYCTAFLGVGLCRRYFRQLDGISLSWRPSLSLTGLKQHLSINFDIFIRTLGLTASLSLFTTLSARLGGVVLATNTLLMAIQAFTSYALDGFANATEALVGENSHDPTFTTLKTVLQRTFIGSVVTAAILSLLYQLCGSWIIFTLSSIPAVRMLAQQYWPFFVMLPILSGFSYWLDGVFIGLLQTRTMRNCMLLTLFGFIIATALLFRFGNGGLLFALVVFFILRTVTLGTALWLWILRFNNPHNTQ